MIDYPTDAVSVAREVAELIASDHGAKTIVQLSRACACTIITSYFDLCGPCRERVSCQAADRIKRDKENPASQWGPDHDLDTTGRRMRQGS